MGTPAANSNNPTTLVLGASKIAASTMASALIANTAGAMTVLTTLP